MQYGNQSLGKETSTNMSDPLMTSKEVRCLARGRHRQRQSVDWNPGLLSLSTWLFICLACHSQHVQDAASFWKPSSPLHSPEKLSISVTQKHPPSSYCYYTLLPCVPLSYKAVGTGTVSYHCIPMSPSAKELQMLMDVVWMNDSMNPQVNRRDQTDLVEGEGLRFGFELQVRIRKAEKTETVFSAETTSETRGTWRSMYQWPGRKLCCGGLHLRKQFAIRLVMEAGNWDMVPSGPSLSDSIGSFHWHLHCFDLEVSMLIHALVTTSLDSPSQHYSINP